MVKELFKRTLSDMNFHIYSTFRVAFM